MAVTKYLDKTGLTYFWSKIKAWCNSLFALDTAVVHKTGKEVITGKKAFQQGSIVIQNPYVELDAFEASYENYHNNLEIFFADKNYDPNSGSVPVIGTTRIGEVQWQRRGNSGGDSLELTLREASDPEGPFVLGSIGIIHKPVSGAWYGYCPSTPLPSVDNSANAIVTRNFIPLDTRILHTSGNEVKTGSLAIQMEIPYLRLCNTKLSTKGTTPSANYYSSISFCDTTFYDGSDTLYRSACVESCITPENKSVLFLRAYKWLNNTSIHADMSIVYPIDSDPYILGITPSSATDDSEKIPTTAWVRDATGNFACNAATATKLATSRTINGVSFDGSANITVADSTKVLKSGDTMTGDLVISKVAPHLETKNTSITRGTAPSSNIAVTEILGRDSAGKSTWALYHTYATDKTHRIRLLCYSGLTTDTTYTEIGLGYDSNGNPYTNAPTPSSTTDNTTKIATTAWVRKATGNFACNAATAVDLASGSVLAIEKGGTEGTTLEEAQNNILKPIVHTSGSFDFNTFLSSSIHTFSADTTLTNCPNGFNGALITFGKPNSFIKQFWIRQGTLDTNDHYFGFRSGNGTVWSEWHKLYTDKDTIPIANGGTESTTRLGALRTLTNESVGTSANYFLTITSSWGKGGYTSVADAKTVLGLGSAAYTASTDYVNVGSTQTVIGAKSFSSSVNVLHSVARGTNPTGNTYKQFNFLDSSATNGTTTRAASVENLISSTGDVSLYLRAYKWTASTNTQANLEIKYPISGDPSLLWNGSDIIKHATVCSDCNAALAAGLYKTTSSTTNAPDAFGGILTVERADDGSYIWQTIKSNSTDYYRPIWTRRVGLKANGTFNSATDWVISNYLPTGASRSLFNNSISGKLAFCPPDGTLLRGQSGSNYEFMRLYHTRDWSRDATGESYGYIGRYSATTAPTATSANQAQIIIGESCGGISSNNFSFGCYYQCASDVVYTDTTTERVYGVYLKAGDTYNNKTVDSVTYFRNTSNKPWFRYNYDNICTLGDGSNRFSTVYAGTGTINTSDERLKDNISNIPDKVLDVWDSIEWVQFKFKESIQEKGDNARIHVGAIAQSIDSNFEDNNIDISKYGFFCYDKWEEEWDEDENGIKQKIKDSGDRYSLRYEEALCIEAAYQRRKNKVLENRISELEKQVSDMIILLQNLTNGNG